MYQNKERNETESLLHFSLKVEMGNRLNIDRYHVVQIFFRHLYLEQAANTVICQTINLVSKTHFAVTVYILPYHRQA